MQLLPAHCGAVAGGTSPVTALALEGLLWGCICSHAGVLKPHTPCHYRNVKAFALFFYLSKGICSLDGSCLSPFSIVCVCSGFFTALFTALPTMFCPTSAQKSQTSTTQSSKMIHLDILLRPASPPPGTKAGGMPEAINNKP